MSDYEKKSNETTPQDQYRKRQAERFKNNEDQKVAQNYEEWFELVPNPSHPKGGKILVCRRTENAVHRQYVGREKEKPEFISDMKKQGKLKIAS